MGSKALHRLAGGLLATLLALFAAVVVATPAWAADKSVAVQTAQQLAQELFTDTSSVQVDEASKTVTVPAGVTVSTTNVSEGRLVLGFSDAGFDLVVDGIVNVSSPIVVTGQQFTISGSGTVQSNATMASSMLQVGLASGNSPTATSVTPGTLSIDGSLSIVNAKGSNYGVLMVRAGSANVDGGATINSQQDKDSITDAGRAAILVGSDAYAGENMAATCTIYNATVTGYNGVNVTNSGSVIVNAGADIDGYGNGKTDASAGGTGILALAQVNGASPSITVKGGEISGWSRGVSAGYASNGMSSSVVPGGIEAAKVSASIDVSGGTITGGNSTAGGDAGIENLFSQADVDVSGGTIKGVTAFQSNATGPQVSGGTFSTPVDPAQVDQSVQAMGVMPQRGGTSSYGYFPTAAAATAAGATATVPLTAATTSDILAYGIIPGTFGTAETPNALVEALKQYGLQDNGDVETDLLDKANDITGNNLYVVTYGASNPSAVTAMVGNVPQAMTASGATTNMNGFNFYTYTLTGAANATAGTYTISVVSGSNATKTATVPVAGIEVLQPSGSSASALNNLVQNSPTLVFVQADASAKAVDLPELNTKPLTTGNEKVMTIGWYQLTPVEAPAAGAVPTSFNAALYNGTTWTPSTPTMIYLTAGYATLPATGITGELAINPTSVTNTANAAQATLTLTIGKRALSGTINLTYAESGITSETVENSDELETTTADVASGVANYVESTIGADVNTDYVGFAMGANATAFSSNPSAPTASLSKAAEGQSNPSINGDVVTTTMDIDCSPIKDADLKNLTNPVSMKITLTNLGVEGKAESNATGTAPTLTQPAATFNVFQGITVTPYGNGTVSQTVDAQGNVTLTATPTNGAAFVGWQAKLGTNINTTNPWTLTPAALASLNKTLSDASATSLIAFFEGGNEPAPPTPPTPTGQIAIYRLYNQTTGEHLLTASTVEFNSLIAGGQWIKDGYDANPSGIAFYDLAATSDGTPVYRLYDYATGTHLYTTSVHEKDTLAANGWHVDFNGGAMFKSPTTSSYPVYRLYNGNLPLNISHLWTASWNEFNTLRNLPVSQRWTPEPNESGVAWFACGVPTGPEM